MEQVSDPSLLKKILSLLEDETNGNELSFVELKENNIDPELMGKSISAIANACVYEDRDEGYLLYGVEDTTLSLKGVKFDPFNLKYSTSAQDLEMWLKQLVLGVDFHFLPLTYVGKSFLIVRISKALGRVAIFRKTAFIRVGKNSSELSKYPERERKIWSKLDKTAFWRLAISTDLSEQNVLELLDYHSYFKLARLPLPTTVRGILERFEQEFFVRSEGGGWSITNLGALLFAKDMKAFQSLQFKTPRVITYDGSDKLATVTKDNVGVRGYANGFESLLLWIKSQIPEPQEITATFREERVYPEKALRELVVNALVHQDFEEVGMRPLIEIFKHRIEVSNPGNCAVDPERILGAVPKARNEILVDIMRRLYICETRGSGIPRIIEGVELAQLPAPKFIDQNNAFKATIYAYKPFDNLDNEEKIRACSQHVAFMHLRGITANNESLRRRFGVGEKRAGAISKLVNLVKQRKLIKDFDPSSKSRKFVKYVPFWA